MKRAVRRCGSGRGNPGRSGCPRLAGGEKRTVESPFDDVSSGDILDLIREHPLAWVVSSGTDSMTATPLPMLADTDDNGRIIRLVGHFARSNPHVPALMACPRALFLFQGPQGYASPSWVSDRTWAPTWNYAVVQIEADVQFRPDETDVALNRLVTAMELDRERAWSTAEMGPRFDQLKKGIIAFEAEVRAVRARFKLGQDEHPTVLAQILTKAPDAGLRRWMRRFTSGKA